MEGKELWQASNDYHQSFSKFVQENGFNAIVKQEAEMKIKWLKLIADRYKVELDV